MVHVILHGLCEYCNSGWGACSVRLNVGLDSQFFISFIMIAGTPFCWCNSLHSPIWVSSAYPIIWSPNLLEQRVAATWPYVDFRCYMFSAWARKNIPWISSHASLNFSRRLSKYSFWRHPVYEPIFRGWYPRNNCASPDKSALQALPNELKVLDAIKSKVLAQTDSEFELHVFGLLLILNVKLCADQLCCHKLQHQSSYWFMYTFSQRLHELSVVDLMSLLKKVLCVAFFQGWRSSPYSNASRENTQQSNSRPCF